MKKKKSGLGKILFLVTGSMFLVAVISAVILLVLSGTTPDAPVPAQMAVRGQIPAVKPLPPQPVMPQADLPENENPADVSPSPTGPEPEPVPETISEVEPAPMPVQVSQPDLETPSPREVTTDPPAAPEIDETAATESSSSETNPDTDKNIAPAEKPEVAMKKEGEPQTDQNTTHTMHSNADMVPADEQKQPNFTIQVGAYREKKYAQLTFDLLADRGYGPYIFETEGTQNRPWFFVRLGEFEKREEANVFLAGFNEKEKMTAVVALYRKP